MAYRIKYKYKNKKGLSLIELILVISILTILILATDAAYSRFRSSGNINIATNAVVEALRYAQKKSQSGSFDSEWSVAFYSNRVEILKDGVTNETNNLPKGISVSGLSQVDFEKLTGKTLDTGTIVVSNDADTINININANGTISY
jgi:prepilin-type N-terminal cleavage/methylation domain-containing protein